MVVFHAVGRSELQKRQFIHLGERLHRSRDERRRLGRHRLRSPNGPADTHNWIATVPGRGWFPHPIFRFYSPTKSYNDKTWKLEDITAT